jgi:hypothetical protein
MADKTFDSENPPVSVTNPLGGSPHFPRHLHAADGSYIEVGDDAAMQQALEDGYTEAPQCNLDGTPFAKDVAKAKADEKAAKPKAKAEKK